MRKKGSESLAARLHWAMPLAISLCAFTALAFSQSAGEKKWALLVGISEYENEDITPLEFAVADVKAVVQSLMGNLGYAKENGHGYQREGNRQWI